VDRDRSDGASWAGPLLQELALGVELVDVAGAGIGGPQVAALIDGHAREAHEMALRGGAAVDRPEEVAAGVELQDHVVARVADEHLARRRAAGHVAERDARGKRELARARAGDTRLAGGGADLAVRRAVGDSPPPGSEEVAIDVELLDPRVAAVGDVHGTARLLDRHPDRRLELTGAGAGAAERVALDQERQER